MPGELSQSQVSAWDLSAPQIPKKLALGTACRAFPSLGMLWVWQQQEQQGGTQDPLGQGAMELGEVSS